MCPKCVRASSMRGSVLNVALRGGGSGNCTSQASGARLAGSSASRDGALDRNAGHLGVSGSVPVHTEAVLKKAEQRLAAHHPAEPGQIRFACDGVEKDGKRIAKTLVTELVRLGRARGCANDVVRVQRRPSGSQHGAHAIEHAHGAGSMRRRCRHGVALRRVARASIARKMWRTHE
jgi:hypothetical protein